MKTEKTFRKLFIVVCVLLISATTIAQKSDKIPVTTASKDALKFYQDGFMAIEKFNKAESMKLMKKAIEADPNFFMPHFEIAMHKLASNNDEKFQKYANKAIASNADLSDAEKLFKEALVRLLKDKKSDLTDLCEKITKLYPKDYLSFAYAGYFQNITGNYDASIKNLKKAIELASYKAPYYNLLGYSCLGANKLEKAEYAFNKYIELEPMAANPYDSKGDYYMAIKDYDKAHQSFMKAYEIDNSLTISMEKANKAKEMLESVGEK